MTENGESLFNAIGNQLSSEHESVALGKMMSSPGIQYKGKNFAFYYNEKMVFKLGKGYDLKSHDIEHFSLLSPFKNKAPMAAWFEISAEDMEKWDALARIALEKMVAQVDKA